jgi:fibronectin type 3 domain-containing protein
VDLTWQSTPGAKSYNVYRSTSANGKFVKIGSSNSHDFRDVDPSLGFSATYFYRISATNQSGEGAQSSQVKVTTLQPMTGLTASAEGTAIKISWTAFSGPATLYRFTSQAIGARGVIIADFVSAPKNFTDKNPVKGTSNFYRLYSQAKGWISGPITSVAGAKIGTP